MQQFTSPQQALRYHVTGAIERGEQEAITEVPRCASIGCTSAATELISYRYRASEETDTDRVCTSCADSYARRPVMQDFTRQPISPTTYADTLRQELRALESDREHNNREWIAGDISYDDWLEMGQAIREAVRQLGDELLSLFRTDPFAGIPQPDERPF